MKILALTFQPGVNGNERKGGSYQKIAWSELEKEAQKEMIRKQDDEESWSGRHIFSVTLKTKWEATQKT